jgi:hypothetical protein
MVDRGQCKRVMIEDKNIKKITKSLRSIQKILSKRLQAIKGFFEYKEEEKIPVIGSNKIFNNNKKIA